MKSCSTVAYSTASLLHIAQDRSLVLATGRNELLNRTPSSKMVEASDSQLVEKNVHELPKATQEETSNELPRLTNSETESKSESTDEYPIGFTLVLLVTSVMMTVFLISLDQVSPRLEPSITTWSSNAR